MAEAPGCGMRWDSGGASPQRPLPPAPAWPSPPVPSASVPSPLPMAPAPPAAPHSPLIAPVLGGRWLRSCCPPGLTVPLPASARARLFPASVSERPAWPGLFPPPKPAPRSQNFPGSLSEATLPAEHPRGRPLAHGLCPRGTGTRDGDGRATDSPGRAPEEKSCSGALPPSLSPNGQQMSDRGRAGLR